MDSWKSSNRKDEISFYFIKTGGRMMGQGLWGLNGIIIFSIIYIYSYINFE